MVLKKKVKSKDEESKSLQEKIVERLSAEFHGAFNSIWMSVSSEQIKENRF
jgi:hypothetical protein